jgi:hypothetical protein
MLGNSAVWSQNGAPGRHFSRCFVRLVSDILVFTSACGNFGLANRPRKALRQAGARLQSYLCSSRFIHAVRNPGFVLTRGLRAGERSRTRAGRKVHFDRRRAWLCSRAIERSLERPGTYERRQRYANRRFDAAVRGQPRFLLRAVRQCVWTPEPQQPDELSRWSGLLPDRAGTRDVVRRRSFWRSKARRCKQRIRWRIYFRVRESAGVVVWYGRQTANFSTPFDQSGR